MPSFKPESILAVLLAHEVEFVVIGGYGAVLQGAPYVTFDIDVTPRVTPDNLDRLSRALKKLNARVWAGGPDEEGLAFDHDAASLGDAKIWNLVTKFGRLDVTFEPSGTTGYDDLHRDAITITVGKSRLPVASLADIVRSKEAADRDKDRRFLPVLREILAKESENRRVGKRRPSQS